MARYSTNKKSSQGKIAKSSSEACHNLIVSSQVIPLRRIVRDVLALPLLALAGRWEIAVLLIIAERMGKVI